MDNPLVTTCHAGVRRVEEVLLTGTLRTVKDEHAARDAEIAGLLAGIEASSCGTTAPSGGYRQSILAKCKLIRELLGLTG